MITRRQWAASVAGAAGALSLSGTAAGQDYKVGKGTIKLGVASYSFRKFPRAKAIQMTKEIGTPYINIKSFHLPVESTPEQIDQARKEFEDAGLKIVGGGTIRFEKYDEAEVRHAFEYGKRAGMPLLVVMPDRETLPKLEKFVKEYDIKIAVHNHGPEDKNFPTPQSALKIVKNMDPRCGLCIDIGHTARTGVDVVESIAEAGSRVLDMHTKDLRDFKEKDSQCRLRRRENALSGDFPAAREDRLSGLLQSGIRDSRYRSDAGHAAQLFVYAGRAGGSGLSGVEGVRRVGDPLVSARGACDRVISR